MKKYIKIAAIVFIVLLLIMFVLNAYHANLYVKEFKEFLSEDYRGEISVISKRNYSFNLAVKIINALTDIALIGLIVLLAFFRADKKTKLVCISIAIVVFLYSIITLSWQIDYWRNYFEYYGGLPEKASEKFKILSVYIFPNIIKILFCVAATVVSIIYLVDVIKNQATAEELEQRKANKIARLQAKINKLQGYETTYETDNEETIYSGEEELE